jgi:hypothetical protein
MSNLDLVDMDPVYWGLLSFRRSFEVSCREEKSRQRDINLLNATCGEVDPTPLIG